MTATAVVVAAGAGERLAAGTSKAFVALAGEPLLVHAVRALAASGAVTSTVVVVPPGDADRAAEVLGAADLRADVCTGGATRQQSVSLGLARCGRDTAVVAVHDAARPLVTAALVRRTVEALVAPWDAVAPALALVDTIKLVDPAADGAVVRTVDRRDLWAVQTPQVFDLAMLSRAHAHTAPAGAPATDDLALVERAGGRVRLVPGERRNFKVTYPEDLAMAEALLAGEVAAGGDA